MNYLRVRDWEEHQTYRNDRGRPPWIKLHRALLRSPKWAALTDQQKGQLVCLWMLAADFDGYIPCDNKLVHRLAMLDSSITLDDFIEMGWLETKVFPADGVKLTTTLAST